MAIGQSTWYFSPQSLVARVDIVNGEPVWTGPADLEEVFPALVHVGVYRDRLKQFANVHVGEITSVQQTALDEAVFDVTVNLFRDGMQGDMTRRIRLDLATGKVLEYPAKFGGVSSSGWREYRIFDKTAWQILNTITRQFIVQHNWADPVFALPSGQQVALPADGTTIGVDRGKLYVKTAESAWAYHVFDLDNRTTDGVPKGMNDDIESPKGFDPMFTMITDPDTWRLRGPAPEFDRELMTAINFTAHEIGTTAKVLLTVLYAQSGLRTAAFHPAGRYGLLQMTAEQLAAAGWERTPHDYLSAASLQLPVIAAHLKNLAVPSDTDEAGLMLSYLLDRGFTPDDLTAPVAAPGGPRPEVWARHGTADMDGDGVLSPEDLHRYLRSIRREPRLVEVNSRMSRLSAVIPDWPTLTEVNEGDDMGIVRPSSRSLGLLIDIVALQQEPGFDHEQVVSIDPPPGTLQHLVDPVEIKVNFEG
ncbi:hypothetical protein ACIBJI_41270 [Nocardia sp. NPDC050408]|uniref:hypothetical protein n=1 Tax=Nocardia sp. NPDC050408 TaxID=3364319 RepID=UPI00379C6434